MGTKANVFFPVNGFLVHDITRAIIKMPQNKILFFILYFLLETNLGFFYAPMKCNSLKSLYDMNVFSPFNFIESIEIFGSALRKYVKQKIPHIKM